MKNTSCRREWKNPAAKSNGANWAGSCFRPTDLPVNQGSQFDPRLHVMETPDSFPIRLTLDSPMKFHVTCQLDYTLRDPAAFLFALRCIETGGQQILGENLLIEPFVPTEEFTIVGGMNRISRITTLNPGAIRLSYQADVSTSVRIVPVSSMNLDGPGNLSPEAIPFLFPSRYCQSDRLRAEAMDLFGHLVTPYAIASGVSDWIYENVAYVSGSSGETSSAIDTIEQRQGVCRDFSHLAIALCRSMSVPARYATCYAYQLDPPDFHACFEVFIDGWWYVFDATRLVPLNGLVRIATGRDAADAAVCTIFGNPELTGSVVSCECSDSNFIPVTRDSLVQRNEAIALL
jgi:transglutaminase-like putative cysteine protease